MENNPAFDEEQVKAAVETEILPAALQGNRGAVQCLLPKACAPLDWVGNTLTDYQNNHFLK